MPGHLFEGNPVDEGTTQRGTDTLVHHPEKPAGSTYSSISGLSPHEELERQAEFHSSTQDEALARYSFSRKVPRSVLKCETILDTLDVTPKVPQNIGLTRGEHRGSRHQFILSPFSPPVRDRRVASPALFVRRSRPSWGTSG